MSRSEVESVIWDTALRLLDGLSLAARMSPSTSAEAVDRSEGDVDMIRSQHGEVAKATWSMWCMVYGVWCTDTQIHIYSTIYDIGNTFVSLGQFSVLPLACRRSFKPLAPSLTINTP